MSPAKYLLAAFALLIFASCVHASFYSYMEAESGFVAWPMKAVAGANASNGYYVTSINSGSVSLTFYVPEEADYVIWGRVLAADSDSDSFFVSIDGGPEDIYDDAQNLWSGQWQWTVVNGRNGGDPLTLNPRIFHLHEGAHVATFRMRDGGSALDKIFITDDMSAVPNDSDTRDLTPPVISQILLSASETRASVSWTTDEPANSIVDFGTSPDYGSFAALPDPVMAHDIQISGLTPDTTYHYRIRSSDVFGNIAATQDGTFATSTLLVPNTVPALSSSGGAMGAAPTPMNASTNATDTQTPQTQNPAQSAPASQNPSAPSNSSQACPRETTYASYNGRCATYSSPCNVPEGWKIVAECPKIISTQEYESRQSNGSLLLLVLLLILAIIVLLLARVLRKRPGKRHTKKKKR